MINVDRWLKLIYDQSQSMTLYWNTNTDWQTNNQMDNAKSRVTFATEMT